MKDDNKECLGYEEYIVERMIEINKKIAYYSMNSSETKTMDIKVLLEEIKIKSENITNNKKLIKEKK